MSIFEVTTRISHKWLERKTKAELASIIFNNIEHIDIFARNRPLECGELVVNAAGPLLYDALKAFEALDRQRMSCEECSEQLERAPEVCEYCFPFADDARCKMRAAIAAVEGK